MNEQRKSQFSLLMLLGGVAAMSVICGITRAIVSQWGIGALLALAFLSVPAVVVGFSWNERRIALKQPVTRKNVFWLCVFVIGTFLVTISGPLIALWSFSRIDQF